MSIHWWKLFETCTLVSYFASLQTNGTTFQQHVGLAVLSFKLSIGSAIQLVKINVHIIFRALFLWNTWMNLDTLYESLADFIRGHLYTLHVCHICQLWRITNTPVSACMFISFLTSCVHDRTGTMCRLSLWCLIEVLVILPWATTSNHNLDSTCIHGSNKTHTMGSYNNFLLDSLYPVSSLLRVTWKLIQFNPLF